MIDDDGHVFERESHAVECETFRALTAKAVRERWAAIAASAATVGRPAYSTAMTQQNMIVKAELRFIPRQEPRSPQNAYHAAYAAARLNTLGRRPQIAPTAGAAHALALRCVRAAATEWAEFTPVFAGRAC